MREPYISLNNSYDRLDPCQLKGKRLQAFLFAIDVASRRESFNRRHERRSSVWRQVTPMLGTCATIRVVMNHQYHLRINDFVPN